MARKRFGRKRFGNGLMPPELKKLANELRAPGEVGRAIPGQVQAEVRSTPTGEGAPAIPAATGRTEISTWLTRDSGSQLLYQAESWVRLRLMLESAGPVAVGTREDVAPPLSGKGALLPPGNVEIEFSLARGNRVYLAATAVNRVRVIVEPIPWAEQIASMVGSILTVFRSK